jgi:GNAT superfamily N-acetyltransferase
MIYMPTTTTISNRINLRPATLADREPIVAWCNTLWNGQPDYIGDVWEYWLPQGHLYVGEMAGWQVPVVVLRLRVLSPTQAWFGGLRIHPELQGQGLGRDLIDYSIEWAKSWNAHTIGYMTERSNQRMHSMAEKLNFANVGLIEWYELNDLPAAQAEIVPDPSLVDLSQAANLQEQAGRYVYQWTVRNLDQAELEGCAERQELYVLADRSGWMICEHDGFIAQIEGDLAAQTRLLAHARTLPECENLLTPVWRGSQQAQLITQLNWRNTNEAYSLFELSLT